MAWLSGTWHLDKPGGYVEERWIAPQGGMMLGVSVAIKDDQACSFEYLRVETRDDTLVYVAHPDGDSPGVEFFLTQLGHDHVQFENPAGEFPQWVRYERTSERTCKATMGGDGGTIEFCYERQN